jgi:quinol monooxygenase YgiN
MYGTIARLRIAPGHEQQLEAYGQEWNEQRGRQVEGFVSSYLLTPDNAPNERLLVAIFRDRDSYRRNAEDPEQDRWYRRMREHLAADPEWTDGEIRQMA